MAIAITLLGSHSCLCCAKTILLLSGHNAFDSAGGTACYTLNYSIVSYRVVLQWGSESDTAIVCCLKFEVGYMEFSLFKRSVYRGLHQDFGFDAALQVVAAAARINE